MPTMLVMSKAADDLKDLF